MPKRPTKNSLMDLSIPSDDTRPDGMLAVEQFDGLSKLYPFKTIREPRQEPYTALLEELPPCDRCQGSGTLPIASCGTDGDWRFFAGACACARGAMRRHWNPKLIWHDRATLGLWGLDTQDLALIHTGLGPGQNYADALEKIPASAEDVSANLRRAGVNKIPQFSVLDERRFAERIARIAQAISAMLSRVEQRDRRPVDVQQAEDDLF